MVFHGIFMVFHGIYGMNYHQIPWQSMNIHRVKWHTFLWITMIFFSSKFQGINISWYFMVFHVNIFMVCQGISSLYVHGSAWYFKVKCSWFTMKNHETLNGTKMHGIPWYLVNIQANLPWNNHEKAWYFMIDITLNNHEIPWKSYMYSLKTKYYN